jgi:predicted nucleotidyltransferase
MQQELQALLDRKVDLISRRALAHTQNRLLREEILKTAKTIFSQGEETHAER